jgi:CxxC-x17-CxxC domain-containing protein
MMHQGNWKCSECGGAITELPFEPRSESGLTCRDCWKKGQNKQESSSPTESTAEMPNDIPEDAAVAAGPMDDDPFAGMETSDAPEPGEKPRFEGEWACAGCGTTITSLPFKPRGDASNLKCLDCFKASKN